MSEDVMEGTRIGGGSLFEFKKQGEVGDPSKLTATRIGVLDDFEKSLGLDKPEYVAADTPVIEEVHTSAHARSNRYTEAPDSRVNKPSRPKKQALPENPTMDDALTALQTLEVGDIVEGVVTRIENGGVFIDFNYKSEGFIPMTELTAGEEIEVGGSITGMIGFLESSEGYAILSKRRADEELAWRNLQKAYKRKEAVEVKVISAVSGGLVVEYSCVRGFVPASHVLKDGSDTLDGFITTSIPVKVIQIDKKRRKCVMSHKMATHVPGASKEAIATLQKIEIGQVLSGRVSSLKDFGAFVDLGGIEGLVHISEMAWSRIEHPSELLQVGQTVNVFVLGIDQESKKISLGLKQLQPDPWVSIAEKYKAGNIVKGTVSRLVSFGAFVKLDDNIEGLVHISELSNTHVKAVKDVVQPGMVVEAKVLRVIPEEQKIGLSIKQAAETPAAEPPRPSAPDAYEKTPAASNTQMADAFKQAHEKSQVDSPSV